MCGFYFTNKKSSIYPWTFEDVKQRGTQYLEIEHNECYAIQSVLPCIREDINFSIYHTDTYIFLYAGEIYNYNRQKFNTDTEQIINDIINNNSTTHYNGMYAYVFYNKQTDNIIYHRDATGQIPLFIYRKDGHTILSTTIKSIVKTTKTSYNKNSLSLWHTSKHYIFNETPWNDIYSVVPSSQGIEYNNSNIKEIFSEIKDNYNSYLASASIDSGGVDSGIVSKWFGDFRVALNHVGKDVVSNFQDFAYDISEEEWHAAVDEFIEETYLFPYTWSWVGYYILGKKLKNKVNILYTGEGADEIFGGYPDYKNGTRTPYSIPFIIDKNNFLLNNKLSDQKYFIPIATMGANLALGCSTIEPRSPFLDQRIINNLFFKHEDDKNTLKKYYEELYKKKPAEKQGFAGFPNEYYNHVFNKNISKFENNNYWKEACFHKLKSLKND